MPPARATKPRSLLPERASPRRAPSPRPPEDNPAFQVIWDTVSAIPRGQVSTYGGVARAAGLPGRARLTGLALRLAPRDMHLPWHRVVGAGGRIVFPKSSTHFREQAKRLKADGVVVKEGRVDPTALVILDEL
jgi:methylated-DNA-protein-cysteine methyltransferase related protein